VVRRPCGHVFSSADAPDESAELRPDRHHLSRAEHPDDAGAAQAHAQRGARSQRVTDKSLLQPSSERFCALEEPLELGARLARAIAAAGGPVERREGLREGDVFGRPAPLEEGVEPAHPLLECLELVVHFFLAFLGVAAGRARSGE